MHTHTDIHIHAVYQYHESEHLHNYVFMYTCGHTGVHIAHIICIAHFKLSMKVKYINKTKLFR